MRREFRLPEVDESFLNEIDAPWECVTFNGNSWLLMHQFPIPEGYNTGEATVAVQIPAGYPQVKLDMVWFHPALVRKDGKPIGQSNHFDTIGQDRFQRWSRHYTKQNPWIPGESCIETHMAMISRWLEREFERR